MKSIAAYRVFFPLGLLNAIIGVSVWFVQNLNWFQTPPILVHSKLIAGGFLWSFIVGFLMTAIPKMTGTLGANRWEYFFSLSITILLFIFSWEIDPRPFYATHVLLVLFLLIFGGRRFLKINKSVPVFFSHVGMGMLLALVGLVFHFQGNSFMGFHLYHLGSVLVLVLGIGTKFFSFLSGIPSAFEGVAKRWKHWWFHGSGAVMCIFLFMAGRGDTWSYLALTIVSLFYLFFIWQVQRPSSRSSALKWGARIVALMIPLGFILTWLRPYMYATWFHLIFIGCFSILTFSVATRVTLAHGAYPTDFEMKSRLLWWIVGLLCFAAISRVLYGFAEDIWWKKWWLHLAGTFWVFAVGVWCWALIKRIFKPGPLLKPSCRGF